MLIDPPVVPTLTIWRVRACAPTASCVSLAGVPRRAPAHRFESRSWRLDPSESDSEARPYAPVGRAGRRPAGRVGSAREAPLTHSARAGGERRLDRRRRGSLTAPGGAPAPRRAKSVPRGHARWRRETSPHLRHARTHTPTRSAVPVLLPPLACSLPRRAARAGPPLSAAMRRDAVGAGPRRACGRLCGHGADAPKQRAPAACDDGSLPAAVDGRALRQPYGTGQPQ
jgi:hypothetical protein